MKKVIKFFSTIFWSKNKKIGHMKSTWQKIYREYFAIEKDFSELIIPDYFNPRKHFAVIVAGGININQTVNAIRKKFNIYLYFKDEELNVIANINARQNQDDYLVVFNKNIEADKKFKNISVNMLKAMGIEGITLLERILLEVYVWEKLSRHLDNKKITICSGSRTSSGEGTPVVFWREGLYWIKPKESDFKSYFSDGIIPAKLSSKQYVSELCIDWRNGLDALIEDGRCRAIV